MKIGWIGLGRHASAMLLPKLAGLGAEIAAICDPQPDALARARLLAPGAATFARARDLLEHPGLDAVGIAVGPAVHAELAPLALARGLPVFVEKPPGATAAQAEAILKAAERARKPVVLGFMKRHSTANRVAFNLTRAPEFGPVAGFLGHYMTAPTYFQGNPDYSGFYLHHCVHYLDLVPWLMGPLSGLRVRKHEASPGRLLLHVDFDCRTGALATLAMGTLQSRGAPVEWWQVMGDHRRVEVRNVTEVRYVRDPSFKVDDPNATMAADADTMVWEPNPTVAADEDHKGYRALLQGFLARVRGETADVPEIADGVLAMRRLDAMRKSIDTGERVALDA
ncbi:MAG: Gfo/Idh/MocA family oxidoreductase [Rhodospirillaceae bacterium]|nr:Gfo/Idh/MocA family oxidoreductase [Rhodospirillaceae bacterium]